MSDGHAVQELLKIAKLLYEASKQSDPENIDDNDNAESLLTDTTIISRVNQIQFKLFYSNL